MPKINEEYLAIRYRNSNLILIYSIKLKKTIRKFILTDQEIQFKKEYLENLIKYYANYNKYE